METRSKSSQSSKVPDEKSGTSNFPSVPPQELHIFAMKIRIKDNTWIMDHVPANPRYLVSSTDYPTIIQAGFHYNALHMAARWGNVQVVQLVLSSVSSPEFVKSLYPEDDYPSIKKRVKFLTDMYLNTPETGACETPLHFACKFNWYEVVKLLLGHPSISVKATNDLGQTAEDIIGTRREDAETTRKIKSLFHKNVIVPIWRDQFDAGQPIVGPVVNPKLLGDMTPSNFVEPYGKISTELFGPVDRNAIPRSSFNNQWKIVGYAGPTDESTALELYSALRRKDLGGGGNNSFNKSPALHDSPPPENNGLTLEVSKTPKQKNRVSMSIVLSSTPKRPTATGTGPLNNSIQELNESFEAFAVQPRQHPRRQSTPSRFSMGARTPPRIGQGTPTRFGQATPTRLFGPSSATMSSSMHQHQPRQQQTPNESLLSNTNTSTQQEDESSFTTFLEETIIRRTDPEKGIERIARRYAKELGIPWVEHWAFLNKFVDVNSKEGLAELEKYFLLKEQTIEPVEKAKFMTPITQICVGFDKIAINTPTVQQTSNVHETPKSSRCFARRTRGRRPPGSADREDWRLHSFIQFVPDELPMNGDDRGSGDTPSCIGEPWEEHNAEPTLKIKRLFTDLEPNGDISQKAESTNSTGKVVKRPCLLPRTKNMKSNSRQQNVDSGGGGDSDKRQQQLSKYREPLQLDDSDSEEEEDCEIELLKNDLNHLDLMGDEEEKDSPENESDDDNEGEERWYSPPTTPTPSPPNESYTDCFTYVAFVKGQNRTKYDDQLVSAISLVDPELLEACPAVSRWFNLMKSLGGSQPKLSGKVK